MYIKKTVEFSDWLKSESAKSKAQVDSRLKLISKSNHFGDCKSLGGGLCELRWKNGRRVYFTIYENEGKYFLALLGGIKNAQNKDIKKARKILERYKK